MRAGSARQLDLGLFGSWPPGSRFSHSHLDAATTRAMDSRPRVAVRIRPSNDGSGCLQLAGGGTVILREQAFKFDHLFDGASGQEDVREDDFQ